MITIMYLIEGIFDTIKIFVKIALIFTLIFVFIFMIVAVWKDINTPYTRPCGEYDGKMKASEISAECMVFFNRYGFPNHE